MTASVLHAVAIGSLLTPLPKLPITAAVAHRAALTPLHGLLIRQAAKICSKSNRRSRSLGRWRIASSEAPPLRYQRGPLFQANGSAIFAAP